MSCLLRLPCAFTTMVKKCVCHKTFFRNHKPNRITEMSLNYLFVKHANLFSFRELSILSFLQSIAYKILGAQWQDFVPLSKDDWQMIKTCTNFFQSWTWHNLYQAFHMYIINKTVFSVSFLYLNTPSLDWI